jgi:RNA polymerase sigma factor FliA
VSATDFTSHGLDMIVRPEHAEAALWRRYRQDKDYKAREKIFEMYVGLARVIARGESRRRPDHGADGGDFEQFAFGALLEAIDRFDPCRGVPFAAFARRRIKGAISDGAARFSEHAAVHRHNHRRDRLASLLQTRVDSVATSKLQRLADLVVCLSIGFMADSVSREIETATAHAHFNNNYTSPAWRDLQLSVMEHMLGLDEPAQSVMRRHYVEGMAFTQIAEIMAVSRARVSQIHRSALHLIRQGLNQRGR